MSILTSLDWLVRTKAPELLRSDGEQADAVTLESRPVIDRAARVATALSAVNNFETNIWSTWDAAWDEFWQQASNGRFADIVDNLPDPLGLMLTGTANEKGLLKGVLRVLMLIRCRRVGRGL